MGKLFETLKGDWERHVETGNYRCFVTLLNYRFGGWAKERSGITRVIGGKIYGAASMATEIFSGISLDRDTKIGEAFHLVHAGHINIHPDVVIGDRVGIMHGVTLGMDGNKPGTPTIEDDVFIGTNASVLGQVTVGKGARVAANSLVIANVPAGAVVVGVPARILPSFAGKKKPKAAPDKVAAKAS